MSQNLNQERCIPCSLDTPPMKGAILSELLMTLNPSWEIIDEVMLSRTFKFPDFAQALNFVNAIGAIAENEGHHPDMELSWGRVRVKLITHKIKGLSRNDFILAAKIDLLQ